MACGTGSDESEKLNGEAGWCAGFVYVARALPAELSCEEKIMNTFIYSYPVKVYFGEKAAAKNLAAELEKVGPNVLLAYGGGSIKKNGVYDELMGILTESGKTEAELAADFVDALADFIREIGLPTTFAEMNIPADTDYKAIAESTVLTGGCAKKFTKEELLEVLLECR